MHEEAHMVRGPAATALAMPAGYEQSGERLLPWAFAEERLDAAENYWLATSRRSGAPHVTPVWGTWHLGSPYFTGIPTAAWARNVARSPSAAVHLESGTEVVIVEGVVEDLPSIDDPALAGPIVARWQEKYTRLVPDPVADGMYRLRARTVRAWTRFPADATRWTFDE